LAAYVPDQPPVPEAFIQNDQVIIVWEDVEVNGSPLLGYKMFFRAYD